MRLLLGAVAYVLTIVAANALTSRYGLVDVFGLLVTAGTFAAGLSLIFRDAVQVEARSRLVVPGLIVAGAALSGLVAPAALAVASGLAFLVSEVVDWLVFTPLRDRSIPLAVLSSSVVAAPVDTVLFLALAGFPVTVEAVAGQLVVKSGLALLVALLLTRREPLCAT